jgi:2-polyprenyl-3-methyl-5-hydroxy-6-metoxy-1,4-benzoquinol methylase
MQYDPIKRSLGGVFNQSLYSRKLFYRLLDLLLLRAWHIHREIKKWARNAPPNVEVLDAGAGFGQYDYFMIRKYPKWNILAIDVKDEQVADCNEFFGKLKNQNVKFIVGDLTKYQKENTYNLIVCVDVMEHIEEDVKVFANFFASMKEDAMLLISTPSDQGGSDVHEHEHESFIDEHVRDGYNIEAIQEKLRSVGFTKTEASYAYGAPGKISWKLSMKYPMTMLNFSKLFFILLPFYYLLTYPICFVLNLIDSTTTHKTGTGLIVKAWK